jgi:hypothetical protein
MAAHHSLGAQFTGPLSQRPGYRAPYHDELEAAARDAANYAPQPDDYYERDDDDYED